MPTARHTHVGGLEHHRHAHHEHPKSHSHPHSHAVHRHAKHEIAVDELSPARVGSASSTEAKVTSHIHISFLGWEFAIPASSLEEESPLVNVARTDDPGLLVYVVEDMAGFPRTSSGGNVLISLRQAPLRSIQARKLVFPVDSLCPLTGPSLTELSDWVSWISSSYSSTVQAPDPPPPRMA